MQTNLEMHYRYIPDRFVCGDTNTVVGLIASKICSVVGGGLNYAYFS
ncbi:MAG: hypothetical protein WBX01_11140 [Nitrososphaeraceae archaeon]